MIKDNITVHYCALHYEINNKKTEDHKQLCITTLFHIHTINQTQCLIYPIYQHLFCVLANVDIFVLEKKDLINLNVLVQ